MLSTLLLSFVLLSAPAMDSALETKAEKIESLLVSPCCWGGTVAEHSSPEALAIKDEVRAMLKDGKSEEEILKFYEAKYGERILARPKKSGFGLIVWGLPILTFLIGAGVVWVFLRRRSVPAPDLDSSPPPLANTKIDLEYRRKIDAELYGPSSGP